jgi:hypothetical protein
MNAMGEEEVAAKEGSVRNRLSRTWPLLPEYDLSTPMPVLDMRRHVPMTEEKNKNERELFHAANNRRCP